MSTSIDCMMSLLRNNIWSIGLRRSSFTVATIRSHQFPSSLGVR